MMLCMRTLLHALLPGLVALAALSVGCARYEFDITRPEDLALHVGRDSDTVFNRPPLEYRLIAVENRLVMRIYNTTDDDFALLGERSTVVDPYGQSHPLPSMTMAPHSYIKLIFPPYRPRVEGPGPTFGIGIGAHVGSARDGYGYDGFGDFYDPFWNEPRYFAVVGGGDDALYWEWEDEGEIRLSIVFQRGDEVFSHEFAIRRVKV